MRLDLALSHQLAEDAFGPARGPTERHPLVEFATVSGGVAGKVAHLELLLRLQADLGDDADQQLVHLVVDGGRSLDERAALLLGRCLALWGMETGSSLNKEHQNNHVKRCF